MKCAVSRDTGFEPGLTHHRQFGQGPFMVGRRPDGLQNTLVRGRRNQKPAETSMTTPLDISVK